MTFTTGPTVYLDAELTIDGQQQPTVREIIEAYFIECHRPFEALGRMAAGRYVAAIAKSEA